MKMVERKSGALVDVPEEKVHAAFLTGQFGFPKGAEVPVIRPGMAAGTVAPTDFGGAVEGGARPATEEEFRKAQMQSRYGGPGGAVEAGAVGFARGAGEAFGVPVDEMALGLASGGRAQTAFETPGEVVDPYKGRINVTAEDRLRERLNADRDLHPIASTAGEVGGFVAGTLAGGPVGKAGAAAERVAGTVARGVFEGGGAGAVNAVNEAALGDEELTASKLLAGIGHGALIGGASTAGIHLASEALSGVRDQAGRWIGKLRPKDIESVAEGHFGYAPEGLGEKLQKFYSKAASSVSGKDAEAIERFTALTPEGAAARRVGVYDAPRIQEEAERAVRKHVDDMLQAGDLVSAEARGGLKQGYVSRAVSRGNEGEVATAAAKQLDSLIMGADEQLSKEMAPSMMKSVETVSKLAYRAKDAVLSGDNAEAFVALDNIKRGVQKLTSTAYRGLRAIADPVDQLNARRTVEWLDRSAEEIRRSLEDSSLWGKAADDQRAINASWSKQIDASKRFHKALTTEVGRDPANPYLDMRGADPAKVAGYVRNLTNPHNDLTHKAVRDFVESTEDLSKAIKGAYDLPESKLAEVDRIEGAAKGFRGTIDKAEHSLVLANQYRQLTEGADAGTLAGALGTIGSVVGGLPGGVLGSVAGGALSALSNPGKVVRQLAAIERIASKVDGRIGDGVKGFLRGESGGGGKPASVAILEGKGGERKVFESKVGEVLRLKNNPDELNARIAEFSSQFESEAPNLARALTLAAISGINYLAAHAPPGFTPRAEALAWGIHEAPLYSDSEMRSWARRAAVVDDPMVALDAMRRRMLTPEEADALEKVHAPIYQQIQRTIVAERLAKPTSLNYQQTLQLELMFKVPLNRTLDRGFMRAVQQSFKVAEPKMPPRSAMKSNISESHRSMTEEARGSR